MSTTYSVSAFIPPDEKWKKMKEVYDACVAAKISVPKEVEKFFNYDKPSDAGVKISVDCVEGREYDGNYYYEVSIDKLPKDAKFVRFEVSY